MNRIISIFVVALSLSAPACGLAESLEASKATSAALEQELGGQASVLVTQMHGSAGTTKVVTVTLVPAPTGDVTETKARVAQIVKTAIPDATDIRLNL